MIPTTSEQSVLFSIYQRLDGLVLSGGVDLHPSYYQEEIDGSEDIEELRDETEMTLTRWALEDDKPIFGICRGQQVLNVALGGTLYQDLPTQLPQNQINHRDRIYAKQRSYLIHNVEFVPNSKLAAIFDITELAVNSRHHQAVKAVGQGLKVTASAPDGVIEALESEAHRWVLSVQWHPEDLYEGHEWSRQLFRAFVEEVQRRT